MSFDNPTKNNNNYNNNNNNNNNPLTNQVSFSTTSVRRKSDGGEASLSLRHHHHHAPSSNNNKQQQQQHTMTTRTIPSGIAAAPSQQQPVQQVQAVAPRSGIRMRANSTDSVRGAFYTGPIQQQQQHLLLQQQQQQPHHSIRSSPNNKHLKHRNSSLNQHVFRKKKNSPTKESHHDPTATAPINSNNSNNNNNKMADFANLALSLEQHKDFFQDGWVAGNTTAAAYTTSTTVSAKNDNIDLHVTQVHISAKRTAIQKQMQMQELFNPLPVTPDMLKQQQKQQLQLSPPVQTVIVNDEDVVGPLQSFPPPIRGITHSNNHNHQHHNNHHHSIHTKDGLDTINDDSDLFGDESIDGSAYFHDGASRSNNSRIRFQQQHQQQHRIPHAHAHLMPHDLLFMSEPSMGSLAGSDLVGGSLSGDINRSHGRITAATNFPVPPPSQVLPPNSNSNMPLRAANQSAPVPPPPPPPFQTNGNQDAAQGIALFAYHANYGATTPADDNDDDSNNNNNQNHNTATVSHSTDYSENDESNHNEETEKDDRHDAAPRKTLCNTFLALFDPIDWLSRGVEFDDEGRPSFKDSAACTLPGFVRHFLYNPYAPEFTSLQQFDWAVILGIFMGFYTAVWKWIMEAGVEFVWRTVPEFLANAGVFTDLDGSFPLYHYMWICPAIMSGALCYTFEVLPMRIPDQNDWINSVHSRGVIDHRTFLPLFILSTVGMISGLSLGPELPLVLTAGMVGSWLGLVTQQSMLQARVLNLTAASAAIGGFFGFPMAGALFVLEIPHRMGLQYFEALSPATISSIVAVLANRMITGNEVTGYYSYPFLTLTLPSNVFSSAVVYGFFGAAIGIWYALCVLKVKVWVHDWFHAPAPHHEGDGGSDDAPAVAHKPPPHKPLDDDHSSDEDGIQKRDTEKVSLIKARAAQQQDLAKERRATGLDCLKKLLCCIIPQEKYRSAAAGSIAGALCGVVGIFVPHTLFWGEAQLQNLIDKGRTPLPVFGEEGEVTADLVALGYCMIDPSDPAAVKAGFSIGCSALICVTKVFVIGLSLGTGIIGGHFWGPLFVGCAASHLFSDVVLKFSETFGFGSSLAAHPCVVILCTMASAHVVTFRAHMAIMLILTLTISAFSPEDDAKGGYKVAGDYSAVFPLLVVSVFVALMVSRQTVFYKTQRSRGDIMAVPEVLCEPGMEGAPLVVDFDAASDGDSFYDPSASDESDDDDDHDQSNHGRARADSNTSHQRVRAIEESITQSDIEKAFAATAAAQTDSIFRTGSNERGHSHSQSLMGTCSEGLTSTHEQLPGLSSTRLDELLSQPVEPYQLAYPSGGVHRRTKSAPDHPLDIVVVPPPSPTPDSIRSKREHRENSRFDQAQQERGSNNSSKRGLLVRVNSYGELQKHQPSLMDQARMRGASASGHRRVPSLPSGRHSRKNSESSINAAVVTSPDDTNGTGSRSHSRSTSPSVGAGRKVPAADTWAVGYGGGALSLDDIEQSFNRVVNNQIGPLSSGRSPWTFSKPSNRSSGV